MAAKKSYSPPLWMMLITFLGWMVLLIDKGLWFIPMLILAVFVIIICKDYLENKAKTYNKKNSKKKYVDKEKSIDSILIPEVEERYFVSNQVNLFKYSVFLFFITKSGGYKALGVENKEDLLDALRNLNIERKRFADFVVTEIDSNVLMVLDDESVFKVNVRDLVNRFYKQKRIPLKGKKILKVYSINKKFDRTGVSLVIVTKTAVAQKKNLTQVLSLISHIYEQHGSTKILDHLNNDAVVTGILNPPNSEIIIVTNKGRVIRSARDKIDYKRLIELSEGDCLTSITSINNSGGLVFFLDSQSAHYKLIPVIDFRFTVFGGKGIKISLGENHQFIPDNVVFINDENEILITVTDKGKITLIKASKLIVSSRMSEPNSMFKLLNNDYIRIVKTYSSL
ncbi:hypothetical protein JoomaDRAFT_1780 [Galbibacter orientalis DSM 19592]|uniref:Uncharacterized protein n=1 Tax=Galbibacter orientalis DSM 19592 TaxID=926559 RepID=I3C594_9FLAO|nr:hypothetical protein [Galbibacter orientalis]EIJ38787.1 hypothetical protein JoomaDRAFT_1780 [Galbibacter orientalis DSM 19592]